VSLGSPPPADAFLRLRERLLRLAPAEIGLVPAPPVWAVLMELGLPGGVVSLAAVADGTTSVCFSSGGGILGAGDDSQVRLASEIFLAVAEENLDRLEPARVEDLALPADGEVRFHALTPDGPRTGHAPVSDITRQDDRLLLLYAAGQEVLTQVRLQREST
jgi:hypothetical protein